MVQVLLKTIWFATLHHAKSIRFHPPFLTFLRSRGGSFRALMIREAALGTTSTRAWRFWTTSFTVIFSPFQSAVVLAMSSPTFLGDCCKKAKDFADTHIANAGNMSKYCTTDVRTKASLGFQQPNIPIAGPWASSPNIWGWPLEDVYISMWEMWKTSCADSEQWSYWGVNTWCYCNVSTTVQSRRMEVSSQCVQQHKAAALLL